MSTRRIEIEKSLLLEILLEFQLDHKIIADHGSVRVSTTENFRGGDHVEVEMSVGAHQELRDSVFAAPAATDKYKNEVHKRFILSEYKRTSF